jgi:hypothetical protein
MESEFSFAKKENYLLMTVTGDYAKEDFMAFADIILHGCEKENVKKVLLDAHNVSYTNLSTMDRFYIGENIANVIGPTIKIGLVAPKEFINKFGENVAVNRGGKLFVTHSFEEAEDWLLNDTR